MLVDPLLVFIITLTASFAGSIQPGPVNLAVIHTSLNKGFRPSLKVAAGGVIPELIYSFIALVFSSYILSFPQLKNILGIISVVFLTLAGIYFLIKKNNTTANSISPGNGKLFVFGFISGIFNPLLLIYWIAFLNLVSFTAWIRIESAPEKIAFITGTAFGAFILLYLTSLIAFKKRLALLEKLTGRLNHITGLIFIILAVWGAFKLLA